MEQFPTHLSLSELISNLLGLSNYQGTPQIPQGVSSELEREGQWEAFRKKGKAWSDDARHILRNDWPVGQVMPYYSGSPNPADFAALSSEEGPPVFFPIGRWSDRRLELMQEKGKRRKPGQR